MRLIKEPLDVDFVVDPRPLTKAEEKAISDFIRADKEKRKGKKIGQLKKRKRKLHVRIHNHHVRADLQSVRQLQ